MYTSTFHLTYGHLHIVSPHTTVRHFKMRRFFTVVDNDSPLSAPLAVANARRSLRMRIC